MKRILICGDKNQFNPFDYSQKTNTALASMGLNSGNNVFGFAIQKMLLSSTENVQIHTIQWVMNNTDKINNEFDLVLYSPANILAEWANKEMLPKWTECLKKIRIPFTFIGVGAQAKIDYNLDFVQNIQNNAYNFIKAILNTGGRLGLRGYFTAEVVKKLGFKDEDFSVLGCPSLYMNGPDLKIQKKEISKTQIKPIFNGNRIWFNSEYHHYFSDYPQSIFVCQDLFYSLLYDINSFTNEYYFLQDGLFLDLFKNNRIKLYCDYLAWDKDLKEQNFNFCVGSRIHGNVTSILAGIPSFVDSIDSRTRELAEFFDIPSKPLTNPNIPLEKLYDETDYSKFNKTFKSKFNKFKDFMNDSGFPCFEDIDYINNYCSKIAVNIPTPNTSIKDLQKLINKINGVPDNDKSNLYKFLHLYWLKGKK